MSFKVMHPLRGAGRLSSPFGPRIHPVTGEVGKMHNGLDIAAPTGTPVYAAADGKVASVVQGHAVSGNYVTVEHYVGPLTYSTQYLHLSRTGVQKGQQVEMGDKIGEVGSTGRSTGPHLHFIVSMRVPSREFLDPATFIKATKPFGSFNWYYLIPITAALTVTGAVIYRRRR
jgi:murein DD-endopeptidase MepM/ murein hydrolase activator NlpD